MHIQRYAAALAVLIPAAIAQPSKAQTICGDRGPIVERLTSGYGERRRVEAVTAAGTLMEIFVSPRGTWTLLATTPGGATCLISAGDGWQLLNKPGGAAL